MNVSRKCFTQFYSDKTFWKHTTSIPIVKLCFITRKWKLSVSKFHGKWVETDSLFQHSPMCWYLGAWSNGIPSLSHLPLSQTHSQNDVIGPCWNVKEWSSHSWHPNRYLPLHNTWYSYKKLFSIVYPED